MLLQAGAGHASYRLEEDIVLAPVRVKTPLAGEVEASEVVIHRTTEMRVRLR